MTRFVSFDRLTKTQLAQYRFMAVQAFPAIIQASPIVLNYWDKVERYFPEFQRIWLDDDDTIIGYICTLPYQWSQSLSSLPDEGWDWLMQKGVSDFEAGVKATHLGGLQIIIDKKHQGKGRSPLFINEGKRLLQEYGLKNFTLPIRPTLKHLHPSITMQSYMQKIKDNRIYDPWLRTHLNSGAKIIRVCPLSMQVTGNIAFWENLAKCTFTSSGNYVVEGALNLVDIDIENNHGIYKEDNIWLYY